MNLLDRLGLELPIAQAGLGGDLATAELPGPVSQAGGLGTIGMLPPTRMASELRRAHALAPGRTVAVNPLMPFLRRAHIEAVISARPAAAVLFFGFDRRVVERLRSAGIVVLHQVGTEDRRALADGADGLIAQGLQAGGHLLAELDTWTFLPLACGLADGKPVLTWNQALDAGGVLVAGRVRIEVDISAVRVAASAAA